MPRIILNHKPQQKPFRSLERYEYFMFSLRSDDPGLYMKLHDARYLHLDTTKVWDDTIVNMDTPVYPVMVTSIEVMYTGNSLDA